MADIEVILGADNGHSPADKLAQMYPKVNRNFAELNAELAQEESDRAEADAAHAESTEAHPAENITYTGEVAGADTVKDAIDTLKTVVDAAIVDGDSSPQASAASVSISGTTYPTLKDRLDTEYTGVNAQLADEAQQREDADDALAADIAETNAEVALKAPLAQANSLQSQVTALVIGSGNANAEVDQAKSDINGGLFDVITNRIGNVENRLLNNIEEKKITDWEIGMIFTGNGNNQNITGDIRTAGHHLIKEDLQIVVDSGYALYIYIYDINKVWYKTIQSVTGTHHLSDYDFDLIKYPYYRFVVETVPWNNGSVVTWAAHVHFYGTFYKTSGANREVYTSEIDAIRSLQKVFGFKKNLLDITKAKPGYMAPDGTITWGNIQYHLTDKIYVVPGKTVYVSKGNQAVSVNQIAQFDINGVALQRDLNVNHVTVLSNCDYILANLETGYIGQNYQIEYDQVTNYIPYVAKGEYSVPDVVELSERISTLESILTPSDYAKYIALPQTIYAVVDHTIEIYTDNITNGLHADWHIEYEWSGNAYLEMRPYNKILSDGWQLTHGSYIVPTTLDIHIKDRDNNTLYTSTHTVAIDDGSSSFSKTGIYIGDSNTESTHYLSELLNLFTADPNAALTLNGTRGSAPLKHEGRGGWKAITYVTEQTFAGFTNPFWNPSTQKFDFAYYLSTYSITLPDYVVLQLGTNDAWNVTVPEYIAAIDEMVESIRAAGVTAIYISLIIPPCATQYPFSEYNYAYMTRDMHKSFGFAFNKALLEAYDGVYEDVKIIPLNANLDTVNNYGFKTLAATRTCDVALTVQADTVHPTTAGTNQLADSHYAFLKNVYA